MRFRIVTKSTIWKVTSIQISRRSAWMASFIGCGTICPPPEVAITTLSGRRRFGP
jgi:hypothetical protein